MALTESRVPALPRALYPLEQYLRERDAGAPSAGLMPLALTQTDLGAEHALDVIAWEYTPSVSALDRRDPDGWLVWWENAVTAQPTHGGLLLGFEARRFSMAWPGATARSYAVAAVRYTFQGLMAAPKLQHATWRLGS